MAAGIRAGDPNAFARLVDQLGEPMLRTANGMLHDAAAAADAVQQACAIIWEQRDRLPAEDDRLQGYCFGILLNVARRQIREWRMQATHEPAAGERTAESQAAAFGTGSADDPVRAAIAREAWELVTLLPAEFRDVLLLRFGLGLGVEETAAELDIPVGTVASRQRRGLQRLRQSFALNGLAAPASLLALFSEADAATAAVAAPAPALPSAAGATGAGKLLVAAMLVIAAVVVPLIFSFVLGGPRAATANHTPVASAGTPATNLPVLDAQGDPGDPDDGGDRAPAKPEPPDVTTGTWYPPGTPTAGDPRRDLLRDPPARPAAGDNVGAPTAVPAGKGRAQIELRADDGQPIRGAAVSAGESTFKEVAPGRYEFEAEAGRELGISCSRPGFVSQTLEQPIRLAAGEVVSRRVVLAFAGTGTIVGTALNGDGTPWRTPAVLLQHETLGTWPALDGFRWTSANDGSFTITRLVPGRYRVTLGGPGPGTISSTHPRALSDWIDVPAGETVQLTLQAVCLFGQIVFHNGEPAVGAKLELGWRDPLSGEVSVPNSQQRPHVDEQGRFRMDVLPFAANVKPTDLNTLCVYVPATGNRPADGADFPLAIRATHGRHDVTLRLPARPDDVIGATLELQAMTGDQPLPGVKVVARRIPVADQCHMLRKATADDLGKARFEKLPEGRWSLELSAANHVLQFVELDVTEGSVVTHEVRMQPGVTVRLGGATADGKTPPGAWFRVQVEGEPFQREPQRATAGRTVAFGGLPPGTTITVTMTWPTFTTATKTFITPQPDEATPTWWLRFGR
ncbi:MAG: sigma-70 family RNA polymerase sigma factor [Planctomycetota bacterium]